MISRSNAVQVAGAWATHHAARSGSPSASARAAAST